jgi:deoxyribonuclease-1-like protein
MRKFFILLVVVFGSFSSEAQTKFLSWNIQKLGKTKSPEEIAQMAQILKDYDIVAIQEVVGVDTGGAQAVALLADELNRKGAKWDYVISDKTESPEYKTERYAFLWKTSKVKAIGRGKLLSLSETVYREPFLMTFEIDQKRIHILNYHSRKFDDQPETEIKEVVDWVLRQDGNVILAGDFNVSEKASVFNRLYQNAFQAALQNTPTTLKKTCKEGVYTHHAIDNIFYNTHFIKKTYSGVVDFVKSCEKLEEARLLSDHLPVVIFFGFK